MKPAILASLAFGMAASAYGAESARYIVLDTVKTSTMQKELQEAADRGYRLVAGQGVWLLSAILEKAPDGAESVEYLLLATSRSGTMQKEMTQAASQGYRFGSVLGIGGEVIVAMQRKKGATAPSHEQKLLATTRIGTMEKEFLAEAANGYRFVGQTLFENWMGAREFVSILERPIP